MIYTLTFHSTMFLAAISILLLAFFVEAKAVERSIRRAQLRRRLTSITAHQGPPRFTITK